MRRGSGTDQRVCGENLRYDGGLNALELVVLKTQGVFSQSINPRRWCVKSVLEAYPDIDELLEEVFNTLDLETLQKLNADVAVKRLCHPTMSPAITR